MISTSAMSVTAVLLLSSMLPSADSVSFRGGMQKAHNHMVANNGFQKKRCPSKAMALAMFKIAESKVNSSSMLKHPGTGMNPAEIKDELLTKKAVYKDGYYNVGCIKDYMFYKGDKFGDNKYDYELGDVANVSIVFPLAYVPKEDQLPMTVSYCYSMCRQLKNIDFFGIVNGRDCYCTPYVKPMAGDDSKCTSVCDGDKGTFCGSKTKSSIFQMHSCFDTLPKLKDSIDLLGSVMGPQYNSNYLLANNVFVSRTNELQKAFGSVGDPEVSNLFQAVRELYSEELAMKAKMLSHAAKCQASYDAAEVLVNEDLTDSKKADEADALMATIADQVVTAKQNVDEREKMLTEHGYRAPKFTNRSQQYYPIMYFENKKFETTPTSCSGKLLAPYVGVTLEQCAGLCDENDTKGCIGFLYVPGVTFLSSPSAFCFTFSQITSMQFYTTSGCKKSETMCYGKFSKLGASSPLDKEKGQKATEVDSRCMPAIGQ
mmetsp:Transcript_57715/g.106188  ORF Transcript_57715/g.106188 Transcript_57715/m.106188 type:complete len:486 (+) Transcript_57715:96-1553(+)